MTRAIDLNSDLGEGYGAWKMGDDAAMLGIVSSANVACGFHAGDPLTILATLREAAAKGVAIGAHVSYPDRVGFGRRPMDVTHAELVADVIHQIGALQGLCAAAEGRAGTAGAVGLSGPCARHAGAVNDRAVGRRSRGDDCGLTPSSQRDLSSSSCSHTPCMRDSPHDMQAAQKNRGPLGRDFLLCHESRSERLCSRSG